MPNAKVLLVNSDSCTGCMSCVMACSMFHEGFFDQTRSRVKILKDEAHCLAVPGICEQCEEAPCIGSCPVHAIQRDDKAGVIEVDRETCTGCGACEMACPYSGVTVDNKKKIALICDLCNGDPKCAEICVPQRAIQYVPDGESMTLKRALLKKRAGMLLSIQEEGR
jgi:carbon-monoxide dehydrogenase iron sulfur subunit